MLYEIYSYFLLPLFSCRSLYINYDTKLTVKKIDLLRFTTTEKLFETAAKNPDNKPFCVPKCFKSGLLPIGQCLPMSEYGIRFLENCIWKQEW